MAKEKACKNCKAIYEGHKCPRCGSEEFSDNFKGRVSIINEQESEVAKKLGIKGKGDYAIKV